MDIRDLIQKADAYGKQSVAETRIDEVSLVDILKNIFPGMSKEQEDAVGNVETEISPSETDLENAEVATQQQGGGEGGAPTTGATASGDQGDGTRGSDTAQANPTPTDGDPGETQANAPDAETQRLIDELNDLLNQMMPRGQTVSASSDQDSITAMRGAINLAESLVREATEEQKAKLGDLLSQLGNSNWAQSNADAYQTIMNRANAAMAASPSATRASAPATPTDGDPGTQAQPQV